MECEGWGRVEAGAVSVRGADARRWCNGLFTNNVRDLPVGAWNRSALVDDRARVFGFLDLLCLADDDFLAIVDGITPEGFLERFDRYVLFDRVELAAPPLARVTFLGSAAGSPLESGRVRSERGGWTWAHRRSTGRSVDWVGPADTAPVGVGAPLDPSVLERCRVEAGIPRFPDDTGDKRLPHELGLRDELLHFEKGCYLGQETIHRVDVMGQVRRRLVRIATDTPGAAGDVVVGPEGEIGVLTSPVLMPDGSGLGLAVVRLPFDAPGTPVTVGGRPGRVA
jgi:folate-binding protein YgfZ